MRELTRLEYQILLGVMHSDNKCRELFIDLYNTGKPVAERIRAVKGRWIPMQGKELVIYRENLTDRLNADLERFERLLKVPFVNGLSVDNSVDK